MSEKEKCEFCKYFLETSGTGGGLCLYDVPSNGRPNTHKGLLCHEWFPNASVKEELRNEFNGKMGDFINKLKLNLADETEEQ